MKSLEDLYAETYSNDLLMNEEDDYTKPLQKSLELPSELQINSAKAVVLTHEEYNKKKAMFDLGISKIHPLDELEQTIFADKEVPEEVMTDYIDNLCPITGEYFNDTVEMSEDDETEGYFDDNGSYHSRHYMPANDLNSAYKGDKGGYHSRYYQSMSEDDDDNDRGCYRSQC